MGMLYFLWVRVRVGVSSIHCKKHDDIGHPCVVRCPSAARNTAVGKSSLLCLYPKRRFKF